MKRKAIYFVLVAAVLGAGYILWSLLSVTTSTYIKVEAEDYIETVLATGKVTGKEVIPLAFQVPGAIEEIMVEEGDHVEKGQVLAVLENKGEKNRILQQSNALKLVEYQVTKLQTTDYQQARENLKQAEAQKKVAQLVYDYALENQGIQPEEMLKQAEIQAESARNSYQRSKRLYENGAISLSEMEKVEESLELAESSLALARSDYSGRHLDLEQAKSQLEVAGSNVSVARNTLNDLTGDALQMARLEKEQAKALLEEAELAYHNTYLRSPQEGYINRLFASTGAFTQTGQEVIVLIPRAELSYVEVRVDEDLTGQIVPGQEAVITSTAFPEEEFTATVYRVSPGIDADRGTFKVRLELDRREDRLVPDLAVFAEIVMGHQKESIVLERRHIYQEKGQSYVFTWQEGRVHRKGVETKEVGNNFALITDGLEPGDVVLTSPDLKEGQQIRLAGEGE